MSFLNLLWIYIINENGNNISCLKQTKNKGREVMYKKIDDMFGKRTKEN